MDTCAPLNTAPAGSISVPEMDPAWFWAGAGGASPQNNTDKAITNFNRGLEKVRRFMVSITCE